MLAGILRREREEGERRIDFQASNNADSELLVRARLRVIQPDDSLDDSTLHILQRRMRNEESTEHNARRPAYLLAYLD